MTGVRYRDDPRGIRSILIDRPDTRNAINPEVVSGIRQGVMDAPGPVVVLGSVDPGAFSSGADLALPETERAKVSDSLYGLYQQMRASRQIIIAAASGPAVGGGAQLLIASDIRIVSPHASIRFLGPSHGLVVGAWGLPSLVGRGRAMDLCLSMRTVDAEEALAIGLVDRIVEDPLDSALDYAAALLSLDHSALSAVKKVISIDSVDESLRAERAANSSWDGEVRRP